MNESRPIPQGFVGESGVFRHGEQSSTPLVLHVFDHSWPVLSGYSIRSRNLIASQQRRGQAIIAITGPLHQVDDPSAQDVVLDQVRYLRTPVAPFLGRALRLRWPIARELAVVRLLRRQILRVIAREPVELVHAHSPALCGVAALQAARQAGVPMVYEVRAFWEDAADRNGHCRQWRRQMTHRLETYVAQHANAVAAIAKPMLRDLESRGIAPSKLFHAPNGVDCDHLRPTPRDERLARDLGLGEELVFGFFGSLYRYEGVSWMVRALAQLRSAGHPVQLLIIGRGEAEAEVREAIRRTNAADYVRWIAHVPHEQIGRYYSVVDVAVYPRRSCRLTELVTPLKPLEAMAVAKPVLASGVGGIRELVENERTGLLFDAEDPQSFLRQAARMIASPSLRGTLAEAGRKFVTRERDWNVLAGKYADIYDFALSNRPLRPRSVGSQPMRAAL